MITSSQKLLMGAAGRVKPEPMVLVFNTALGNTTIEIPFGDASLVNVVVDWGDGTSDSYTTNGTKTKTYASGGTYTVEISGSLERFGFNVSRPELTKCLSFGTLGIARLAGAFQSCVNLTEVPSELPSSVSNLANCFNGATSFNQDISTWDVTNVLSFGNLFVSATSFNQNINSWNTSNVTNMLGCFAIASSFNQPLNNWNTSSVTQMQDMFNNASAFNQNIGGWDVSKVTNMSNMFLSNTAFNQDIGGWDMGAVTSANQMFRAASAFNRDLSGIVTGLTSQPTDFSREANATFRTNANGLKPFLADGVTQINT